MSKTTDIEKENLEAHVELCAERYKNLDDKLQNLDARMGKIEQLITEVKAAIASAPNESNKTIIAIGATVVGAMMGGIITLIVNLR